MPIASRSWAKAAMNGCSMPAPAPWASTRHVFAEAGRCISPDTRICSLTEIVTDCGMEDATPIVCTETQVRRGAGPCAGRDLRGGGFLGGGGWAETRRGQRENIPG